MTNRILTLVLAGYLALVAWGTLGPSPGEDIERVADRAKAAQRAVSGDTGQSRERAGGPAPPQASRARFAGLTGEEAANIVMFVPFGLLVPMRWPRWWWATVPAGIALSALIELVQLTVLTHRSPQWADIGWNGTGAAVGFALWGLGTALWRRLATPRGTPG